MYKQQQQVKEFMEAIGQTVNDKPTIPSPILRVLRVRLLLEEVLELAEASGVKLKCRQYDITNIDDSFEFYTDPKVDVVAVADAISDITYVNEGAALVWGIDTEPCFDLVQESNMSKVDGGWKDENGKWRKGPNFIPLDLTPEIARQSQDV